MERMGGKDQRVVCVTGGSGYVASWLIKLLLQRDYTVRATVCDLSNQHKFAHLMALEGAQERLQLFQANQSKDGSFDPIVVGCDGVFHVACPTKFSVVDPQAELIEPAVNGTLNILRSCSKAASVRHVVITSSIAAVDCNRNPRGPDAVINETWFSDVEFCKEQEKWYWVAKTLQEKVAWKYAEQNGTDIVVMNSGLVLGPLLQPTLNPSCELFLNLIKGNEASADYLVVDVRDVALAHILAFEIPSASGRYLLIATTINRADLVQLLHSIYPCLSLPTNGVGDLSPPASRNKAEILGINFTPLVVTLRDAIQSLMEKNYFKI